MHLDQAHKVLRILRGPHWNVTAELTDIKVAADKSKANKRTWKPKDFLEKGVWKPFLIAIALMYFFQFTAINIVLMFTPDIFKMSDPQSKFIDEFLATILVGNNFANILASSIVTIIMLRMSDTFGQRFQDFLNLDRTQVSGPSVTQLSKNAE